MKILATWCTTLLMPLFVTAQQTKTLFRHLSPEQTGIAFGNHLTESDSLNILNQANIYNGGGVGVGDFNNDGLPDLYFAGNMVPNKLYINKGSLKFEDRTTEADVDGHGRWCTGVTVVDINADGMLDIYVAASFHKDAPRRTNLLYVNQGNSSDGTPQFRELAAQYGIADTGYSTHGIFFDYDRDGDLDLYLVTNALYDPKTPIRFRPKVTDGTALNTDRLYRNNGNNSFTNVSKKAGITIEGWGHAASVSDFNLDGWPDIYVANDFVSNDILYINNKDGTFTNKLEEYFKHSSWNAMGTDVVDINNDGLVDLLSLEMLPEYNLRKKRMLGGNEYYNYFNNQKFNYQHQYVRNSFQLNMGMTPKGHPMFSDVGFLAGIYQTDWSWCPLIADFDNDGLRDIIITNGLPRDVTDLDYIAFDNEQRPGSGKLTLAMTESLPVVKLSNYAFKNKNGITFENTTDQWGLTKEAFTNGGVYVDLDNDGDLDIVVNNINDPAYVYENTLITGSSENAGFLRIRLSGIGKNTAAVGARITIYYDNGKKQYYEHLPSRGYLSTVTWSAHFGLGDVQQIDSLVLIWPDGKTHVERSIPVNQELSISQTSSAGNNIKPATSKPTAIFQSVAKRYGINFKPTEKDFIDYNIQATLPHKISQYGPGVAVGDIDNNGYDDFFVTGGSERARVFFMQDAQGTFKIDSSRFTEGGNVLSEDMGAVLFDLDNDGDLDLYIVSGSYEIPPGHPAMQNRLYINDGKGKFTKSKTPLPAESTNGSCVRAADFDKDGFLDLFVGGRVVSGAYPTSPASYIYRNVNGKLTDVTAEYCPQLESLGMITDALWSDFDNDGLIDLVIAGEWMPITFLKNTGKAFISVNELTGISSRVGWWNSLASGDFDNDGDIDYVAGNLGLNSNYTATDELPMTIVAKDFDENGSFDAITFCYLKSEDGTLKPFPMHARDDMISQMAGIRKKFPSYKSYGLATFNDLLSEKDRENAIVKQANYLSSTYIENLGGGKFNIRELPLQAQAAPVFGMISRDIDNDNNLDIILVGNDYSMEPYSGRHDALMGLCLKGDGKGNFSPLTIQQSGFFVEGDAKGLATVHSAKGGELIVATQNQDSIKVFSRTGQVSGLNWLKLKPDDAYAEITLPGNITRKEEFYYGSTYLSQSTRRFAIPPAATKVVITNFKSVRRIVKE